MACSISSQGSFLSGTAHGGIAELAALYFRPSSTNHLHQTSALVVPLVDFGQVAVVIGGSADCGALGEGEGPGPGADFVIAGYAEFAGILCVAIKFAVDSEVRPEVDREAAIVPG